jgi:hypothetical protein
LAHSASDIHTRERRKTLEGLVEPNLDSIDAESLDPSVEETPDPPCNPIPLKIIDNMLITKSEIHTFTPSVKKPPSEAEFEERETSVDSNQIGEYISSTLPELLVEEALGEFLEIAEKIKIDSSPSPEQAPQQLAQLKRLPEGIRTNIHAANEYLSELVEYLLSVYSGRLISRFNNGVILDPLEVIQTVRDTEINLFTPEGYPNPECDTNAVDLLIRPLLDERIYNSVKQEGFSGQTVTSLNQHSLGSSAFMNVQSLQKTFHKALFDCFNEIITQQWRREPCVDYVRLITSRKQTAIKPLQSKQELEGLLMFTKDAVLEMSSMFCGLIPDKEDSMMESMRIMDPLMLRQIREERMLRLLSVEVVEGERKWVDYSKEELITLIDCADKVCEELITSAVIELQAIQNTRASPNYF